MIPQEKAIVIFDGYCNVCNGWVDFILKRDKKDQFYFTANQNEAGKEVLSAFGEKTVDVSSVYLFKNGKLHKRSAAALRVFTMLPFPWMLMGVFILVPSFIRDVVYNYIANNRYKWYGKKESCRIPTAEERAKFLA